VIHGSLLLAVHVHPATVATVTVPVPAVVASVWLRGVNSNAHDPAS
jgi:hypothetical protein